MAITQEEVAKRYPIHWLVWNDNHEELRTSLEAKKFTAEDLELKDPRGRTPLLLAVTLGYTEAARLLIDAGADVNCEKDGWTAVQEATASGDSELLSLVLSRRDYQRLLVRSGGIPELLHKLSLAPDFYVEMKWEFTSWVPLVSRMCPFDTYKVYKRGGNVRVDTTLVGFENNRWQRGDRTYIFRGQGRTASLVELDHEAGTSWCEFLEPLEGGARAFPAPSAAALAQRLAAPLAINYLDTDKISFERNKSGIWGWRQDKTENVNGYECKVFSANNVELVSKTRTEHLPKGERRTSPRAPLAGLLALAEPATPSGDITPLLTPDKERTPVEEQEEGISAAFAALAGLQAMAEPPTSSCENTPQCVPNKEQPPSRSRSREEISASGSTSSVSAVGWQEYFSGEPLDHDVGKPRDVSTKVQKFKATLWLCEDYPLELQEQIMPILDLMAAISSPHFAKLKDFIQMQLPAGFPVKIEIPLFHVLNARITFGNIFATESPVPHIECIHEGARLSCVVDDACFSVGRGYRDAAHVDRLSCHLDDEEGLLQYAIQQSLMEAGTSDDQVDVWEALRGARPTTPRGRASPADLLPSEETQLQRAIEASLRVTSASDMEPSPPSPCTAADGELAAALALSAREQASREQELVAEQRALDEALRLSLLDH